MNRQFKFIEKIPDVTIDKPFIVLDIETTGLNPRKDSIVGIAFTTVPDKGYYTTDIKGLMHVVQKSKCAIICHNAVFDMGFLKQKGYSLIDTHVVHDTMLLADIINPDRPTLNLKELSVEVLGTGANNQATKMYQWLTDNNLDKDSLHKAPQDILVPYAAEDAINTYELFVILCKKVKEICAYFSKNNIQANPWDYYINEVVKLLPVVVNMQINGVKLDLEKTAKKQTELAQQAALLSTEITEINKDTIAQAEEILCQKKIQEKIKRNKTGKIKKNPPRIIFNWDSNDHLKTLFLKVHNLPITKKTQKGNASVDSEFLVSINDKFPWIKKLLEYKELKKLTSTYLNSLLEKQEGGFIHANFHLAGTATGRFSSSNPNLQNLPKHGGIKSLFVAREDHKFIYADYSQLELRIAAHLSEDSEMLAEYAKDNDGTLHSDLHQRTAEALKIDRAVAKNINFAIVYNASGWRIAEMMGWMAGIPLCEGGCTYKNPCNPCAKKRQAAKKGDEVIKILFGKYKNLKLFVDRQKEFMLKYFITISPLGKLRRLNGLRSEERKEFNHALKAGFNLPIQSFGASLCKRSMVAIHRKGYHIVNNIHDAIIVEVPKALVQQATVDIKHIMETIYPLKVPLVVEPKILDSFEEK